jgi:cysteinyl-tRNA synthetase
MTELFLYNTLSRQKEVFEPLNPPFVGLYVCGPTVYGDGHLGHARPAITFDVLFRFLRNLGYKVRYVRNITDVGHLENDADEGEDKIGKKARLEQLEPMEVVQHYADRYHQNMDQLNCLKPSIEPRASGHIPEQIEMVKSILSKGLAYEVNGSVYFDVERYNSQSRYGKLSGRVLEDMYSNTRSLEGQDEKRNSFDFALWKNAKPEHIMRWNSEWGAGFPGWHIECSAMSAKYLGKQFDIHGGGMDLLFPHHESEIAQSVAANGIDPVRYWLHNNMITINGQKMGKSLGNFITLNEFFSGSHVALEKAYSPMTIRFFILQAHYRSTLDFSNEALIAAEKGLQRLMAGYKTLGKINAGNSSDSYVSAIEEKCISAMLDDLNSPIVISYLFEAVKIINSAASGSISLSQNEIDQFKQLFDKWLFQILGLKEENENSGKNEILSQVVNLLLDIRMNAKQNKDFATSDRIRNELSQIGFVIKDKKDGFEWELQ